MRELATPLGTYWIDDYSSEDTRIGLRDVELVDNRGPDSTYRWSLDQEEALLAAAAEVHASLSLLVPGGWRLTPGTALPAFEAALARGAARRPVTGRRSPVR